MLFLGGPFPAEMEADILTNSKGAVHYAANKFQWNFIDGFQSIPDLDFRILSAPFVGTFPKEYRKLFVKGLRNTYKNTVPGEYVPFCNLWGYRNLSRKRALIKRIKNFAFDKEPEKVIIVYSPHTPFLQAAVYAKKKDPSVHICLIVPDLPEYMNLFAKKSLAYRLMKKIDIRVFQKHLEYVDSFVLITEPMKEKLGVGTRPYVVVEGTVNLPGALPAPVVHSSSDKQTIVYAGTLKQKFGIMNLVEAFHRMENTNIELVICGRGDTEEAIDKYASEDKRIRHLGQVSAEESAALIASATLLVNPRQNNEEYTKYSFPIKTMEYLLSGVPVIAYELDGMPEDYKEYIFFPEVESIEGLRDKIEEVLNLPEKTRLEFGLRARDYVIRTKTSGVAASKIMNMISDAVK